jgi:ABC-type transport system involved in multi-copper enzyme maturation permease subunit
LIGGPLFVRELLTAPRHARHFGIRAGYVAALCILMYTGAQTTFGLTPLRSLGDTAHFGAFIFSLLASVQLAVVLGASLLFSAGSVAQEKDRRTLILLLMTDLRASELVLGKSLASLLPVLVLIAVSFPVFCFLRMLGGITLDQIVWVEVLCLVSALAAASWGTMVGYWREKTFQILAVTLLGAGLFIGLAETVVVLVGADSLVGRLAGFCDPFRSLHGVLNPLAASPESAVPVAAAWGPALVLSLIAVALSVVTCLKVRIWNPSREVHEHARTVETAAAPDGEPSPEADAETIQTEAHPEPEAEAALAPSRAARVVWTQPIIWREICTQAYGRKVGIIKGAYYLFAVFSILWLSRTSAEAPVFYGVISAEGLVFVLLSLLSVILVNAQSVTSLTSERDGQTLELLLVTEVTAQEFIFGKLGGILFNTKEVILVPLLFAMMSWMQGHVNLESFLFVVFGYLVLVLFAAMLGLHAGLSFEQSRSAILNSLGTIFFLFVGIFICMILIAEARTSFLLQFVPFLVFILGGSLGLWVSLTHKNPSPALTFCAWGLPFLTFYAIVSFLLGSTAAVFFSVLIAYGFTTIAMLVPAVSAFDVALGRTSLDH